MPLRDKPQFRFAARASLLLAGTLTLWWFVLRPPLLEWVRFSGALLLRSIPVGHAPTGIQVTPGGTWNLQLPAPGTPYRSARVAAEDRLPTLYTVNLPVFWAFLFAGPWSWRLWRSFLVGSGVLLLVQPLSLLAYGAHVLVLHVYQHPPAVAALLVSFADYLGNSVLPYMLPLFLAFALQGDLRALVLSGEPRAPEPAAPAPAKKTRRTRRPFGK